MKHLVFSFIIIMACLQTAQATTKKYVSAVGVDFEDCLQTAVEQSAQLDSKAMNECESDVRIPGTKCVITARPVSQYPDIVGKIPGYKRYDLVNTQESEQALRAAAITWSEWQSIIECEAKYPSAKCEVVERGEVTDFHVETRRRFPIFGKKEVHTIVAGRAVAKPLPQYKVACWAGVEAEPNPERPGRY